MFLIFEGKWGSAVLMFLVIWAIIALFLKKGVLACYSYKSVLITQTECTSSVGGLHFGLSCNLQSIKS